MLNNQLSAKELYSTNPSQFLQRSGFRIDPDDSAFNSSLSQSNSQTMNSQMENSQSSSFDRFSQMMMSQQQGLSQQTENANNPQHFYMKYMSKAPLFNKEPDKNLIPRRKSFQEQLDSNKQKAKERDDRDLINTFINLVKECTEEVKSAATDIRKDVDKNISESASQFSSLIQKINEDLKHYQETLLDAVKTREDQQAILETMQQDLTTRDAKIEVLEMQLAAASKQRDERLVDSVLEAYTEQQQKNREQMDKMQEEQQAFCKTQMDRLQQDQQKYLQRCEAEREVQKGLEPLTTTGRRVGRGEKLPGTSLPPPVTESDYRPNSWQGVPQSGCHTQSMRSYQENPGFQNKMFQMQSNSSIAQQSDVSFGTIPQPTSVSLSNHGNHISLPSSSVAWSMPLEAQNREFYLQTGNQCFQGYNSHKLSAVNQQERPAIPHLQTTSSRCQEHRLSRLNLQQCLEAPPLMSPPGNSSRQGPWNSSKLRPSPMAAVAPQVKPQEVVHPSQEQSKQDNREEHRGETPQAPAPKKKKGKKRYLVAVKTKKQPSRAKSKQKSKAVRKSSNESDQENQPIHGERGRCTEIAVPAVEALQPAQTKRAPIQPKTKEDIYEYKEEEEKKISNSKCKPQGRQKRVQQTSRHEVEEDAHHRGSKDLPRGPGRQSGKVSNPAAKQPVHQPKVVNHQPKVVNHQPKVVNHQPKVVNHQPKVVNHQPKVVNHQPKVVNHQTKVVNHQPKVVNHQTKVVNHQPKVVNHQTKVVNHLPRASHQDVSKCVVASVTKKSRGKQKKKASLTGVPSEDGIFSQARVSTYTRGLDARRSNLRPSINPKFQNQKPERKRSWKEQATDVSSSGDEYCENPRPHSNSSQDLSSQDERNDDREEQTMEPIKIQRKTKKKANKKMTEKPVSHSIQPHVSRLDTMTSFSDQEDSSQEMIFSLKLPDSPCLKNPGLQQAKHARQTEEQVVPIARSSDILSTPYIQLNNEQDSDTESVGTTYSVSVGSGRKLSRHMERKRRLSHFSGASTSAAMVEITNSLRRQQQKIRRVSSCR